MSRQEIRYPRLGEQVDRLVRSLAAVKGWKMTSAMAHICQRTNYGPDMVHRWRQGKIRPHPETLEILAEIGKEVNLPRDWGESMLNAVRHPDTTIIVNRLWGPKEIRSLPCNLPSRDRTHLIGRHVEIARLLELLSPNHAAPLITVDGIGGVGKTALVLEVAYQCWRASTGEEPNRQAPRFDAIIFVSAKQQYLTPDGILLSNEAKRTLRDIFREIASTLEHFEITHAAPHEQFPLVHKALERQRTLLIVDNLETMEDKQEIMSFLYELPHSAKVIMTTRERVLSFSPIRLDQLSQEEAINLIESEAQGKEAEVIREEALNLYRHIGGIPAALVYAVGQIASGYSVATILERVPKANSDVARFCFEGSLEPLRGQSAHHLLMAMAIFPKPPLGVAVAYTAGLISDQIAVEEDLTRLRKLSLIREQEGRYIMLPLTREYALSELAAHASFEREARMRWVEWYLNFTQEYGGKDWKDWRTRYDRIEEEWENLLTVFDWCASHEQYEAIQTLWQERYLVKFAHIYGYWDDRLFWLNWLIQAAEKRGDWSNAVRAMIDIGSTLILMGLLEDAERQLQRAWKIHKFADPWAQLILAQKIAYLQIEKKDFVNALSWLDQAKILLDTVVTEVEEREGKRRLIDFLSHRGLIFYKQKDYKQAELYYTEILNQAQAIGWQRVVILAQTHLAYIAIAQDRLEEAEALLQTSLLVDKDKRFAAFHKHTFAYFYQKKGNLDEARRLAREARDGFERLGMIQEARETDELLQELQA
jgi:tetratricopeptide (TPR) repeat protein